MCPTIAPDWFADQPLNNVEWCQTCDLTANDYNPNILFKQELTLLKFSLLKTGWTQPILVTKEGCIIDGFHRWMLSDSDSDLISRYNRLVPVIRLDITEPERMLLTIRINRAKGTHQAIRMHDIINSLHHDHHYTVQEIAQGIGGSKEEVKLLLKENVFKALNIENHVYSKAWEPNK